MEALFTLTLFGSVIWFWISIILFIGFCFISEKTENGVIAFVCLIIFAILYHFLGDVKAILAFLTLINISIYLVSGLIYSAIKTFFAGRELGKDLKGLPTTGGYDSQAYVKSQFIEKLKGNVFRWWFMWPISLINWLLTDLIGDIWSYVYDKIKNFYNYILELGINSIKN